MKTILLITTLATTAALVASAGDAKGIYEKQCAKCHGADGKGQTKMGKKYGARDYTDPKVQADVTDEDIKGLVAYMRTFKQ